jgi:AcrR family transcriptional regulator
MNAPAPQLTRASREPQQGRSRASYERMLAAAEALLIERGSDDFALTDVAKLGKVSIGSIYCRFDSKDDLLGAVQHRALTKISGEQMAMVEQARARAWDLRDLVFRLVDGMAESLKAHAPVLRPFMLRAATDPATAQYGKRVHKEVDDALQAALAAKRDEIPHPDPDRAAASAIRIMYAAIARHLGFGTAEGPFEEGDWGQLKTDLGHMCAAFLRTPPPVS